MAGESKKLPDLPKSSDKFWSKADVQVQELKPKLACQHYFEYRSGTEVVCKNCHIGFFIYGGGLKVENGKLVV